jgi:hypothetical protein
MPATHRFPSSFKALVLQNQREQQNKSLHNDVRVVQRPIPALKPGEILVKINAAGFNHREVCLGSLKRWKDAAVTFLCIVSSGYDEVNTLGLYPAAH